MKNTMDIKKQWIFSLLLVIGLTIGSALMMKINYALIRNVFVRTEWIHGVIDPKEGGLLAALEMGIIPIFALLAFGFYNRWSWKQILSISWKIFVIGFALGLIVGSTYTAYSQSFICGIIH